MAAAGNSKLRQVAAHESSRALAPWTITSDVSGSYFSPQCHSGEDWHRGPALARNARDSPTPPDNATVLLHIVMRLLHILAILYSANLSLLHPHTQTFCNLSLADDFGIRRTGRAWSYPKAYPFELHYPSTRVSPFDLSTLDRGFFLSQISLPLSLATVSGAFFGSRAHLFNKITFIIQQSLLLVPGFFLLLTLRSSLSVSSASWH